MAAIPPPPPPPPPRERRAPTTGAALTLAAVAIIGWSISMVALSGLGLMLWTSDSKQAYEGAYFSSDRGTATLVAVAMLVVAALIYLAPRLRRTTSVDSSHRAPGPEGRPPPVQP